MPPWKRGSGNQLQTALSGLLCRLGLLVNTSLIPRLFIQHVIIFSFPAAVNHAGVGWIWVRGYLPDYTFSQNGNMIPRCGDVPQLMVCAMVYN